RQIVEARLVFEPLGYLQIDGPAALAEIGSAARGELIVVEVEEFLAVEPISGGPLPDHARRDLDIVRRFEKHRQPSAIAFAVVDVLLAVRADRIDEPGEVRIIEHAADGTHGAHRQVERALRVVAPVAALGDADAALDLAFERLELRLIGDVADCAADRTGAEQGALRPAQGLDAVQVEKVEVRSEQRQRDRALVEVDADLLLDARLVANDLARGDAADRDLALARPEVLDGQVCDVATDVFERLRVRALDIGLRLR